VVTVRVVERKAYVIRKADDAQEIRSLEDSAGEYFYVCSLSPEGDDLQRQLNAGRQVLA